MEIKHTKKTYPASEHFLLHALLEEGVPPGLADDEVGPLDNHDAGKEAGVTGVFHNLPLLIGLP